VEERERGGGGEGRDGGAWGERWDGGGGGGRKGRGGGDQGGEVWPGGSNGEGENCSNALVCLRHCKNLPGSCDVPFKRRRPQPKTGKRQQNKGTKGQLQLEGRKNMGGKIRKAREITLEGEVENETKEIMR